MRDRRVRIVAAAGVLGLPLVVGTSAAWVDSVTIGGTPLTAGAIDLRLDDADSLTGTTLAMPAMVPGSRSAQVVMVGNAGTAPLRWSMTGQLGGADAEAYGASAALSVSVVPGGTRTTSASGAACTGGTRPDGAVTLTPTLTQVAGWRATVPAGQREADCVEVALASDAPTTLQGRTTSLTLVATGTSDLG